MLRRFDASRLLVPQFLAPEIAAFVHHDEVTWRAVVIAHAVADVCLLLGIVRVNPSLGQAFRRAYQE